MQIDIVMDGEVAWEKCDFPFPETQYKHKRSYRSMYMLKDMLTKQNLVNGQDYIFCQAQTDNSFCCIAFKDSSHMLFCKLQWLSSDFYNGRIK